MIPGANLGLGFRYGPGRLRESRRSDSPTGAGGTPEFPRGAKGGGRVVVFRPRGNSGGLPTPVGESPRRDSRGRFGVGVFSFSETFLSLRYSLRSSLSPCIYTYIHICIRIPIYVSGPHPLPHQTCAPRAPNGPPFERGLTRTFNQDGICF